jgi:hypothetical protein
MSMGDIIASWLHYMNIPSHDQHPALNRTSNHLLMLDKEGNYHLLKVMPYRSSETGVCFELYLVSPYKQPYGRTQ